MQTTINSKTMMRGVMYLSILPSIQSNKPVTSFNPTFAAVGMDIDDGGETGDGFDILVDSSDIMEWNEMEWNECILYIVGIIS